MKKQIFILIQITFVVFLIFVIGLVLIFGVQQHGVQDAATEESEQETRQTIEYIQTRVYHETVSVRDIFTDYDEHRKSGGKASEYELNRIIEQRLMNADTEEFFTLREAPLYAYEEILQEVEENRFTWWELHEKFPFDIAIPTKNPMITLVVFRTIQSTGEEGFLYLVLEPVECLSVFCYVTESLKPTGHYAQVELGDTLHTLFERYLELKTNMDEYNSHKCLGTLTSEGIVFWFYRKREGMEGLYNQADAYEIWRIEEIPYGTDRQRLTNEEIQGELRYVPVFVAFHMLESILLPEPVS
jgi:hypothetical protein